MWSTPIETLENFCVLLSESQHIVFSYLFVWYAVWRLIAHPFHVNVGHIRYFVKLVRTSDMPEIIELKWRWSWGLAVCYIRSKRAPYLKNLYQDNDDPFTKRFC